MHGLVTVSVLPRGAYSKHKKLSMSLLEKGFILFGTELPANISTELRTPLRSLSFSNLYEEYE